MGAGEGLGPESHANLREGLRNILADTSDFVVAGEASNGNAALAACASATGTW